MITIRKAQEEDFDALYKIGRGTPELQVSATEAFMEVDEFLSAIRNNKNIFLVAEIYNSIVGFIYISIDDIDKPLKSRWACLMFLAVTLEYRKQGVAQKLYDACIMELKLRKINHLYSWVSNESDGAITRFMKKQGFQEGHKYTWMDKEI